MAEEEPAPVTPAARAAGSAMMADAEEYVYDEYAVLDDDFEGGEGEGAEGENGGGGGADGWFVPEIDIWDEDEGEADLHDKLEVVNGWREGSDSEGEVDYPDEESGDDDSEDEMGGRGSRRMH